MPKKKIKKVQLNKKDKVVTGLIGGLGEYFKVDATLLRILAIIAAAMSGFFPLIIAYFVASLVVSQQA
jgi:phage shock protein C